MTDIDQEVQDFLKFMQEHGNEDMLYRGDVGLIVTKGCDGQYGTCCAKQYDMTGLVDALRDLVSQRPIK